MSELPLPEITALNKPWYDGLQQNRLLYPSCSCGHRWLPVSTECPNCLHADRWSWAEASGDATVESFVVYHTAYHPAFKERVPYNVAIVSLNEGPRLISSVIAPNDAVRIGMKLRLKIEQEQGMAIARFAPTPTASRSG